MTLTEPMSVLAPDGKLNGHEHGLSKDELLHCYRTMIRVRAFDDTCMKLQRSGRIGFSIPNKGIEATQVGAASALRKMRKKLQRHIPQLAQAEFEESWAGMIDATPDVVPVMDEIASCPGLYLATGFSGHGFGIGPGAGQVMADLVTGRNTGFDLSRFRFSRFYDGSKMRPGPAI